MRDFDLSRAGLWAVFFLGLALAWLLTYRMAVMPHQHHHVTADFWALWLMWAIMQAAMMGPSFVPTLTVHEDLVAAGASTAPGSWGISLGYFLAWGLGASLFAAAQYGLMQGGMVDAMGALASPGASALLLAVAGLYQFSPIKEACLSTCRSPITTFISRGPLGLVSGLDMGLRNGAVCIVCCWAIMALGFVGGVMNLAFMGLATLLMTVEKLPDLGRYVTRPLGYALIALAAVVALGGIGA